MSESPTRLRERKRTGVPILDSDWEAELCRVAEAHPNVFACVKNLGLGFEVPYLRGSEPHKYLPDFIVLVNDGQPEMLYLIVEIKGYRGEHAKDKHEPSTRSHRSEGGSDRAFEQSRERQFGISPKDRHALKAAVLALLRKARSSA